MTLSVAMVTHVFYPSIGGAQTHTLRVSQKLQERGVKVTVFTRHYAGLARYEEVDGVPVFRVGNGDLPKALAAGSYVADGLRVLLRERERYDLIHCHQMISPMTLSLLARRLTDKPLVINPHRSGVMGDIGVLTLRRPVTGRGRIAAARRDGDAFIAISRDIQQELRDAGVPDERIWYIPNGVDPAAFSPADVPERERLRQALRLPNGRLALFAGRLSYSKGLDVLLEAWPAVVAQVPDARLVLVGEGELHQALGEQIARLGIGASATLAGGTDDVAPYLRAADAFVLPSRSEGLPIALLEAMATGLPCVATAVGGSSQLIEDGTTGRLTPPERPEALATALVEALTTAEAQEWGARARRRVRDEYSLDTVAERYMTLYETLLQRRGRSETAARTAPHP